MLRLSLDRRFQHLIFADATATILNEGMIGAKVVEINIVETPMSALVDESLRGPAAEILTNIFAANAHE